MLIHFASTLQTACWAIAIFFLPGYFALTLTRKNTNFDLLESFCLTLGLSLAIIPLTLYLCTLLGIRQNPQIITILLAMMALVCMWDWLANRRQPIPYWRHQTKFTFTTQILIGTWLLIIFIFTLVARLWSVRGLDYPLWTDSYTHSVITQIIVDSGMIPSNFEPYAPIDRFTYHFGFHTIVAWLHWVSGLSVPRSMVIGGQVINALVVPTTYLFAKRFFDNQKLGIIAALIVGLLSDMPAQFVNWGRYTQLTGQILLPIALVLLLELKKLQSQQRNIRLLATLAFSGLFLVHTRIFIFGIFFGILLLIDSFVPTRQQQRVWKNFLLNGIVVGCLILLLLMPWLYRFASGFGGRFAREVIQGYNIQNHGDYFGFSLQNVLELGANPYLFTLAICGALLGIFRLNRQVLILMGWIAVLFTGANLHLIGITPSYSNTIVIIILYLPVTMLGSYTIAQLIEFASQTRASVLLRSRLTPIMLTAVMFLSGMTTIWQNEQLVAQDNQFVRPADLLAMEWIRQNVPDQSLFYVATYFWTPIVAHGLDAGYWLPYLAQRQTILPPQLYTSDGSQTYANFVNKRIQALSARDDILMLWQTMKEYQITHIYIGSRKTDLEPQLFDLNPAYFSVIYSRDGVWIFKVK